MLASKLLRLGPVGQLGSWGRQLFAWPYFIFAWNLMARSSMVGNIMFEHLGWKGDALMVHVPAHKGDQTGERAFPRHVYANPLNPNICPILALAVLIFSSPAHQNNSPRQVFVGEHSESRFSEVLRSTLSAVSESEKMTLGGNVNEFGTHSARKGSPTYVLGMVEGPNPVQVFLRAGWTLGNVQDRYLFSGEGGDQLCGRAAAGLPITDELFAALPPRLTPDAILSICDDDWSTILPGYTSYPVRFRAVIPYLLASLLHHVEWLKTNLLPAHPLFSSRFWTSGRISSMRDKVLVGHGRCEITCLEATGVPHHLVTAARVKELAQEVEALRVGVRRNYDEMMGFLTTQFDINPKRVGDWLLQTLDINGAVAVTRADLEGLFASFRQDLLQRLNAQQSLQQVPVLPAEVVSNRSLTGGEWRTWTWGGKLHPVPEDFIWPTITVKLMWDLWHFGNREEQICPYKRLNNYDLKQQTQKVSLSKAKRVMHELDIIAADIGCIRNNANTLVNDAHRVSQAISAYVHASELTDAIFNAVWVGAIEKFNLGNSTRLTEMQYNTLYARVTTRHTAAVVAA